MAAVGGKGELGGGRRSSGGGRNDGTRQLDEAKPNRGELRKGERNTGRKVGGGNGGLATSELGWTTRGSG